MPDDARHDTPPEPPISLAEADAIPRSTAGYEADVESPTSEVVRKGGTFSAFRYRDYTLFWSGALVSNVGSWMQMAILGLLVYSFRSSEADLGVVNGLSNLPVLFLAIPAGLLADRLSANIELPNQKDLTLLAPEKKVDVIEDAMKEIAVKVTESKQAEKTAKAAWSEGQAFPGLSIAMRGR